MCWVAYLRKHPIGLRGLESPDRQDKHKSKMNSVVLEAYR